MKKMNVFIFRIIVIIQSFTGGALFGVWSFCLCRASLIKRLWDSVKVRTGGFGTDPLSLYVPNGS